MLFWRVATDNGDGPCVSGAHFPQVTTRTEIPAEHVQLEAGDTGAGPWPLHLGITGWRRRWARQQGIAGAVTLGRQTRLSSSGRGGQTVPGGQTAQGKRHQRGRGLEERLVVGCSLGEILFYAEVSQREHGVLGNCQQVLTQCPGLRVEVGLGDAGRGSRAGEAGGRAPEGAEGPSAADE